MSEHPTASSAPDIGDDRVATPCSSDGDPRVRTFGLILEAHSRITRLLDTDLQASDGISLQTFEVLLRIGRSPEAKMTMSRLASEVSLTTGGVTRLADRLEKDGLVQRVNCPSDRRVVHLQLTERGGEVLEAAMANHLDSLQRHIFDRVDPAEVAVMDDVFDRLRSDPD